MPKIEVSNGELLDRWSVLVIKANQLSRDGQLATIQASMQEIAQEVDALLPQPGVSSLLDALTKINEAIWQGMDELEALETDEDAGVAYARVARMVTRWNRERALCKREIDRLTESRLREVKGYFSGEDT